MWRLVGTKEHEYVKVGGFKNKTLSRLKYRNRRSRLFISLYRIPLSLKSSTRIISLRSESGLRFRTLKSKVQQLLIIQQYNVQKAGKLVCFVIGPQVEKKSIWD